MKAGALLKAAFGPYRILALLGQGGSGAVYRAWDPRLEREVALKILHERSDSDPERARQFMAEARAASALSHPNIVTVFDAAFDGDTPYVVSELINGRTLRDEIRGGAVPPKRLLDLGTQIADGLSAAHDARIVHRDLKPENIMVTRGVMLRHARVIALHFLDPSRERCYGRAPSVPPLVVVSVSMPSGRLSFPSLKEGTHARCREA